jgi:prophage tail gpP-like protein
MPNPLEICEVACGGARYRDWTHVNVQRRFGDWASSFNLAVVEMSGRAGGWAGIKLKPGDQVTITLAGTQVINGFIEVRQAVVNARSHGVQVQGRSRTGDLVSSSAIIKPGHFKDQTFEAIAKRAIQPFGINMTLKNLPEGASRPFKMAQVFHGETVFQFLERLARQRGIIMTDDPNGNLIGGGLDPSAGSAATLEEGRNIVDARALIRDDIVASKIEGYGQNSGSDSMWGAEASQIKATADNPTMGRYKPLLILAEDPLTKRDLQDRVDREQAQRIGTAVQCSVTVQGWHKPGGGLWREGEVLTVKAPSLFPNPGGMQSLAVEQVTYAQDPTGGTTTTLDMVLPQALGMKFSAPQGGAPNMFDPGNQQAKPE